MKRFLSFIFLILMLLPLMPIQAQANKAVSSKSTVSQKIEVYYFHFTRRCNTCESVEKNAKLAVEALYADKVKSGEYTFKAYNLDEDNSKTIAEKLKIGGQTLIVVCGSKTDDITSAGFMNAHDLEKMKEAIKKSVSELLRN